MPTCPGRWALEAGKMQTGIVESVKFEPKIIEHACPSQPKPCYNLLGERYRGLMRVLGSKDLRLSH